MYKTHKNKRRQNNFVHTLGFTSAMGPCVSGGTLSETFDQFIVENLQILLQENEFYTLTYCAGNQNCELR